MTSKDEIDESVINVTRVIVERIWWLCKFLRKGRRGLGTEVCFYNFMVLVSGLGIESNFPYISSCIATLCIEIPSFPPGLS